MSNFNFEGLDSVLASVDKYVDKVTRGARTQVSKSGLAIQNQSKVDSPVKTGRLRSGNQLDVSQDDGLTAEIYNIVLYAIYVHEGTKHMSGRPFMYNAFVNEIANFQAGLADLLNGGVV